MSMLILLVLFPSYSCEDKIKININLNQSFQIQSKSFTVVYLIKHLSNKMVFYNLWLLV